MLNSKCLLVVGVVEYNMRVRCRQRTPGCGGSGTDPRANNGDICHTSNIDTLVSSSIYHLISTDISNFCPKLSGSMLAFSISDGDSYYTIFISITFYMFLSAYQSKSSLILQIGCKPHNASIFCNLFHKCQSLEFII